MTRSALWRIFGIAAFFGLCLAMLALAAGCAKEPGRAEAEKFFRDWLRGHGEKNIVRTADGIGLKGNDVRLKASIYGTEGDDESGYTVETEFRIRISPGREIIEYVAGIGRTKDQAFQDSLLNFMLTTFHPVYKSFINPEEPHTKEERVTINGAERRLVMGDVFMRGTAGGDPLDLETINAQVRETLLDLPIDGEPHWIKIVYFQEDGAPLEVAVTLDNGENEALAAAVAALEWPRRDGVYMVKQFIVIR